MLNYSSLNKYPFQKPPLNYNYDSLEPFIDSKTMHLHYDKHLQTYVDNLNKIIADHHELWDLSVEELILNAEILPQEAKIPILRNAGGVINHVFYFNCMTETKNEQPPETVVKLINKTFGSFDKFKNAFKQSALGVFGSGYTWLMYDAKLDNLSLLQTANQDTPLNLTDASPILNIDVWEHAYYLKNYNKRDEYIDNWFNVVNWKAVECSIWSEQALRKQSLPEICCQKEIEMLL